MNAQEKKIKWQGNHKSKIKSKSERKVYYSPIYRFSVHEKKELRLNPKLNTILQSYKTMNRKKIPFFIEWS